MRHLSPRSILLTSVLLAASFVSAQVAPVAREIPVSQQISIRGVQFGDISTPEYSVNVRGTSVRRDRGRNWLMVSAEFDTQPAWMDEVTFTFYVVLDGQPADLPPGSQTRNMFSGSVTYMNVKKGRHIASLYLDPNTYERFGRPTHVAVIANVAGQLAGGAANPQASAQTQWWKSQTPHSIPLLRRDQTPFALVEIESHNTIKP